MELVQEIHQLLMDREDTCHRTCFSLQLNGNSLDNFAELKTVEGRELSKYPIFWFYIIQKKSIHVLSSNQSSTSFLLGLQDGSVIKVVEEQYTVREARIHVRHVRDLLKSADNTDAYSGVDCASLSFLNTVCHGDGIAPHERRKNNSATGGMPAGNGAAIDCTPPEFLLPSR